MSVARLINRLEPALRDEVRRVWADPFTLSRAARRRIERLAANGRWGAAAGLLADAGEEFISETARDGVGSLVTRSSNDAMREAARQGPSAVSAAVLRRHMAVRARRESSRLITGLSRGQRETFRRLLAARFRQARAAAEERGGRGDALSPAQLVKDVIKQGWGLDARRAAGMAAAMERGETDAQLFVRNRRGIKERAWTIARTEASATVNGAQLDTWRAMRLPRGWKRRWILTPDERLCPICSELDGATAPIGGTFPGGYSAPPDPHPNCRCSTGLIRPGKSDQARKQLTADGKPKPAAKTPPRPKPKPARPARVSPADRRRAVIEAGGVDAAKWNDLRGAERDILFAYRDAQEAGDLSGMSDARQDLAEVRREMEDVRFARAGRAIDALRPEGGSFAEANKWAAGGENPLPRALSYDEHLKEHGRQAIGRGSEFLDRAVSPNLKLQRGVRARGEPRGARAAADPREHVFGITDGDSASVTVHETTHIIEYDNPDLWREARAFRDSRNAAGERLQHLGPPFEVAEQGFHDRWREHTRGIHSSVETGPGGGTRYPGRVYREYEPEVYDPEDAVLPGKGSTELVTMGMQYLYDDPAGFAEKDPEYFDWIIGHVVRRGLD